MIDVTRTTTLLLEGLHDRGDAAAWSEFDRRYRPILVGFLRALGANEIDASDVAQETMVEFLEGYRAGRYDRGRGRLRTWLMSIGRTQLALARRRAARRRDQGRGAEDIDATASKVADPSPEDDALWEVERRRTILREAFERLRAASASDGRTLEAFELMIFRAVPPAAVAAELSMSMDDVYQAKSRITQRLRSHIAEVERAFEGDGE